MSVNILGGGFDGAVGFDVAGFVAQRFLNIFFRRNGAKIKSDADGTVLMGIGPADGIFQMVPVDVNVLELAGKIFAIDLLIFFVQVGMTQAFAADGIFSAGKEQSKAHGLKSETPLDHVKFLRSGAE